LLRSLLSVLVIMPIVAVALAWMFDVQRAAEITLVALAISPVPPLLLTKEAKAGGQPSYGLALMVVLSLLSIATIPATVEILQRVFARPLGASSGAIALAILTMAVLPLIAGMLVRAALPALAGRIDAPVAVVGRVLLPVAVVLLLAGTWRTVWAAVGEGAVVVMIAFVVVGLVVGHILGGPDRDHSIDLALSTACRHPAIALTTASANFPDQRLAGTVLLYVLVSAAVVMPYVAWQRARTERRITT
jgi:BASS family bile acid:Na+ symporter